MKESKKEFKSKVTSLYGKDRENNDSNRKCNLTFKTHFTQRRRQTRTTTIEDETG